MSQGTFGDGWRTVPGEALVPQDPTVPPPGETMDYQSEFEDGRADALERFKPGQSIW